MSPDQYLAPREYTGGAWVRGGTRVLTGRDAPGVFTRG